MKPCDVVYEISLDVTVYKADGESIIGRLARVGGSNLGVVVQELHARVAEFRQAAAEELERRDRKPGSRVFRLPKK